MNTHTATYSPEDNKLRLYVGRVPRADYDKLRAAGFTATPKQDCDFVATWTPNREDLAREFLEEDEDIGDEDYSPQERAADRAERFEGYRGRRAEEATGSADTFDAGPSAFGHQNRARAERQARRHDRHRIYAASQWSKAEYWRDRTAGVIANALYKSSAAVRRSRILRLEAEQRKQEKTEAEYAAKFAAWSKVATMDGANVVPVLEEGGRGNFAEGTVTPALRFAYTLANSAGCWGEYTHPRKPERKTSLYSLLTDQGDPITPAEAAAAWLKDARAPNDPESSTARWADHYRLRLEYERAMLEAEGGSAADADMEPGGWIRGTRTSSCLEDVSGGWLQIQGVNRSPATGRVVSVKVWGTYNANGVPVRRKLVSVNIERLPEGDYRPPTDEERAAFKESTAKDKAERKATTPAAPSLINPTDEDAERLQALWNAEALASHKARKAWGELPAVEVVRMSQKAYSERSKGDYGPCETSEVTELLKIQHKYRGGNGRTVVFKVHTARRVVILTDKPQKPLPWSVVEAAKLLQPTADGMFHRVEEVVTALGTESYNRTEEQKRLLDDAAYVGWITSSSESQKNLTDAGGEAVENYRRIVADSPTANRRLP